MSSTALPSPRRRCPTPGGTHGRLKSRGLHRKTRKPENQRKTKKPSIGTPGGEVKYGRTWDRNCLGVGIVLSGEGGFLPWSGTLWWLHAAHPIPSGLKVARAWEVNGYVTGLTVTSHLQQVRQACSKCRQDNAFVAVTGVC